MPVFCHRGDTLSMLVMDELVEHGVAVKIVDILPPSGEGIAVHSDFSKENWTDGLTHSFYVSSEEDVHRVVQKILHHLWHEKSLPERADARKEARNNERRERRKQKHLSATAVASG